MVQQQSNVEGRFQPYVLEPGAPSAFACFGTWENIKTCEQIEGVDDPLDGCSQSAECRKFTLEQNPPTTRFRVKPRRDGRFEIQQFRDFIRDQVSYHMDIVKGKITITFPGKRSVPKSKRFFLHVKHLEEGKLDVDGEFELIMSLEQMVLRQAGAIVDVRAVRVVEEDPDARRKRIAEKLRMKAGAVARQGADSDDDLELDIDIDIDIDDDDDDDDEEIVVKAAPVEAAIEEEVTDDDSPVEEELDIELDDADVAEAESDGKDEASEEAS